MRVRHLPRDDRTCGWYQLLEPPEPARRLHGHQSADWVVVGAGVTGLAAARRLAEHHPRARILLLEAQRVGLGASGRNSGFATALGHHAPGANAEERQRRIRLGRAGIAALREQVRTHAIDCAWDERGRLHAAVTATGLHGLERFRDQLDELGEPYEMLDSKAFASITGTSYYREGLHVGSAALVQPAALVRGLASHLPRNVELLEESPVVAVQAGAAAELEGPEGSVRTPHLLLTTNAFTPELGFLRRRIFPLCVFASLTRPLTPQEQEAIGGDREWGLVPEEPVGSTVRRTRDQRILIRNSLRYAPRYQIAERVRRGIRQLHRRSLRARFPALDHVEFDYSWGGVVGITSNRLPFFGRIRPGVYAAVAFNGVGLALGTISGALLADLAVGSDSELLRDRLSLPEPSALPPRALLGLGVRAMFRLMHRRAGAEV